MEILQHIGAYAGLAAVVGLAVLSALYFSQARDVKRLREWAGRAPERAAEQAAVQRVTPQPQQQPKPVSPPVPGKPPATPAPKPTGAPTPGAAPAPAAAAAAGATPATAQAKPAAATPAGQAGKGATVPEPAGAEVTAKKGADGDTEEAEKLPAAVPAAAQAAEGPAAQAGGATQAPAKPSDGAPSTDAKPPQPEPATAGGAGPPPQIPTSKPPTPKPPTPKPPTRPVRRPAAPSQTAILRGGEAEPRPWHQRLLASPRYLVLAIAGILVVGGAAAFGVAQLSKEEAPTPKHASSGGGGSSKHKSRRHRAPVSPSSVTVSVLNGTTVPGLAAQIGDKIQSFGFQLGNVTNSGDRQRAESVVMYAPNAQREAAAVGRKLGIAQREPIDPQTQSLAGDATVVVVAGGDQTQ